LSLTSIQQWATELYRKLESFVFSRSGDEWKSYFLSLLARARALAQERGEAAALIGFISGVLIVFFVKVVLISVVVVGLAALTIIIWADSRPPSWPER